MQHTTSAAAATVTAATIKATAGAAAATAGAAAATAGAAAATAGAAAATAGAAAATAGAAAATAGAAAAAAATAGGATAAAATTTGAATAATGAVAGAVMAVLQVVQSVRHTGSVSLSACECERVRECACVRLCLSSNDILIIQFHISHNHPKSGGRHDLGILCIGTSVHPPGKHAGQYYICTLCMDRALVVSQGPPHTSHTHKALKCPATPRRKLL